MRLLVDTNIIIDYLQDRRPFSELAELLLTLAYVKEHELWVSSSQVTDAFYLLSEGGKPALAENAKHLLRQMRQVVRIGSLGELDIDAALDSPWEDFEDACVYQCACKVKADAIITRNQKDFARSSIKVFDCDELFTYLKDEKGLDYGFIEL